MDTPFVDQCFQILNRTPATLDAMLRGLPEEWTQATEGPGTWSPYTVIGHLIHCERVDWFPRLQIILEHGPSRPFDPFDREAQFLEDQQIPLNALLDQFTALRRDNLSNLGKLNLEDAQLQLQGTHPALGLVTARQLLATWTAHDLGHILQISRVMARCLKQEVGPWAEYLSVMQ